MTRSSTRPSTTITESRGDERERNLPRVEALLDHAGAERQEGAEEREAVEREVGRRGEDADRAEDGVARPSEEVRSGDVRQGEQPDERPAQVALDEREHAATEREAADDVKPEAVRLAARAVDGDAATINAIPTRIESTSLRVPRDQRAEVGHGDPE